MAFSSTDRAVAATMNHTRKVSEFNPRAIEVRFSPGVKSAFSDLNAAVHFSEDFDPDTKSILQRFAGNETLTISDVLPALPLIAEETFRYIRATGSRDAESAWREICSQMAQQGFELAKRRNKTPP